MELWEKDLKYIWHPCSQMKDYTELKPIIIKKGKGIYLYDINGKEYIDIISSWWCNLFGHCNQIISDAIKLQLNKLEHVIFANFSHEPAIELCELLSANLPKGLTKFHFSDNGSASVECALKMAFQYHFQKGNIKRKRFMCLSGAYHGETIGALSVGQLDLYNKIYKPLLIDSLRINAPDCYRCPYGGSRNNCNIECLTHAQEIFKQYAESTCAIIIEPLLQCSAGMRIYPSKYLSGLRELCNKYNVLLIADEIATGFGRTGKMFAFNHANVSPDIMCLSKGLTGGYMPMSLTVTTDEIYNAFYADYNEGKAFMHSHTYSGNPLACSAAIAVQKIFNNNDILKNAQIKAEYLHKKLKEILYDHPNIGEIRNIGLINAIEIVNNKKSKQTFPCELRMGYKIYKCALEEGLLLRPLGDVLYFNPPLNITNQEIDKAVHKCNTAIRKVLPLR